jgi:hypothetical protein
MAGDWIKMRVGLTTNPKVMRLAECLLDDEKYLDWAGLAYGVQGYPPSSEDESRNERHAALRVTRYVTVTALLRFWGYANEHEKNENIVGIFPEDVDEIVGVPGFAHAIEVAGWAVFSPNGGLSLPGFAEHNTSAGARSSGADRQKRYRENRRSAAHFVTGKSDVTRDVTVTPREEKRREEKKEQKISPAVPADAPVDPAKPEKPKAKRPPTITEWLALLGDADAIPETDPVYAYAEKAGIPDDFLSLSWAEFKSAYTASGKRQKDFPATYRNAVKGNWYKLWWIAPDGEYRLTTAGEQAKRAQA